MAEIIKENFDIEVKLVPSAGGAFEVSLDGHLIFSRLDERRFPETEEILRLIRGHSEQQGNIDAMKNAFRIKRD